MGVRGSYGETRGPAEAARGASLGTWIVGGLLVGGAVLWARHQSSQIEKLYRVEGLPYQTFGSQASERASDLSSTALNKIHGIARRFTQRKKGGSKDSDHG